MYGNIVFAVCGFILAGVSSGHPAVNESAERATSVALCSSYCDVYGYYQPQKYCVSDNDYTQVYCCGSQNNRYCCTDSSKDVGDMYPNVKSCPKSGMWGYQWRILIGLLGSLIVMLSMAACCYYCCARDPNDRARRQRRRVEVTDANGNRVELRSDHDGIIEQFDPESPYAFSPPEYDSLPKDPPKYVEICGEGHENEAFHEETEIGASTSSPASDENADASSDSGVSSIASYTATTQEEHGESTEDPAEDTGRGTTTETTADIETVTNEEQSEDEVRDVEARDCDSTMVNENNTSDEESGANCDTENPIAMDNTQQPHQSSDANISAQPDDATNQVKITEVTEHGIGASASVELTAERGREGSDLSQVEV